MGSRRQEVSAADEEVSSAEEAVSEAEEAQEEAETEETEECKPEDSEDPEEPEDSNPDTPEEEDWMTSEFGGIEQSGTIKEDDKTITRTKYKDGSRSETTIGEDGEKRTDVLNNQSGYYETYFYEDKDDASDNYTYKVTDKENDGVDVEFDNEKYTVKDDFGSTIVKDNKSFETTVTFEGDNPVTAEKKTGDGSYELNIMDGKITHKDNDGNEISSVIYGDDNTTTTFKDENGNDVEVVYNNEGEIDAISQNGTMLEGADLDSAKEQYDEQAKEIIKESKKEKENIEETVDKAESAKIMKEKALNEKSEYVENGNNNSNKTDNESKAEEAKAQEAEETKAQEAEEAKAQEAEEAKEHQAYLNDAVNRLEKTDYKIQQEENKENTKEATKNQQALIDHAINNQLHEIDYTIQKTKKIEDINPEISNGINYINDLNISKAEAEQNNQNKADDSGIRIEKTPAEIKNEIFNDDGSLNIDNTQKLMESGEMTVEKFINACGYDTNNPEDLNKITINRSDDFEFKLDDGTEVQGSLMDWDEFSNPYMTVKTPDGKKYSFEETDQTIANKYLANTIENEDGTKTKVYKADENGNKYVENYDAEGNLKSKVTFGEPEVVTQYNSDGSRTETYEKDGWRYIDEYKTDGTKTTSEMMPDSGEVQSIKNYDTNGKITSETYIDKDGAEMHMPKVKIYNEDGSSTIYTYRNGELNNVEKQNSDGDTEWDLYVDPFGSNDRVVSGTPDYDEINANRGKADALDAEFEAAKEKNEKVSEEAEKIEAQAKEAVEKSGDNQSTDTPTTNSDTNGTSEPTFTIQSAFLNTDFTKPNTTDNNTTSEAPATANTTEQAAEASEFAGTELEGTNIDEDIKDLPEGSTHTVTKNNKGTYTVNIDYGDGTTGKIQYSDKGSLDSGRIDYPDGSRDEIKTDSEGKITIKYDSNNDVKETVLENEDGSSTKIMDVDENGYKSVKNYDSNGEIKSQIIYGDNDEVEQFIQYDSYDVGTVYFKREGRTEVIDYNTNGSRTETFEIDGITQVIKYNSNGDEEYSAFIQEDGKISINQIQDDTYYTFSYDENGNLDRIDNSHREYIKYNDDGEIESSSMLEENIDNK